MTGHAPETVREIAALDRNPKASGGRMRIAVSVCMSLLGAIAAYGVLPIPQKEEHCGVASVATLLPIVGGKEHTETQDELGIQHNARIPEFHMRFPKSAPPMQYYPEYRFSFQPILAEMLIDRGFCVVSTRAMIDRETGAPKAVALEILQRMLDSGKLGVVSFDTHYMAVTRYDKAIRRIRFADPLRPNQHFSTGFEVFTDGKTRWHANPYGLPYDPWYGRMLFFWQPVDGAEREFNEPGLCPYCRKSEPDESRVYCKDCGVYIDRRTERGLYRALDILAMTTDGYQQTGLALEKVQSAGIEAMTANRISEADWRNGLLHYPLPPRQEERMISVAFEAKAQSISERSLSTSELEALVSSGAKWRDLLATFR